MALAVKLSSLPDPQQRLWPELARVPPSFVLYGGTAVALRYGHRVSVDFDFFSSEPFDPFALQHALGPLGTGITAQAEPNTLVSLLDRGGAIKVSFFGGIGSGRIGNPEPTDDGCIRIASPLDLLATKLKTILQRSDSKDYRDIAALLRAGVSLMAGLGGAAALYPPSFPVASSIKALGYFDDLEDADLLSDRDRDCLLEAVDQLVGEIPIVPLASRTIAP
jgi:hypothetical protein